MAFETGIGEAATKQHSSIIALDQIFSHSKNADNLTSASKPHGEVQTAKTATSNSLPHLDLVDSGSGQTSIANSFHSFVDGTKNVIHEAAAVGKDLAQGAYHEVKDHPGKVLGEVAKGFGYGVLGVAAIAVLPEVAVVGVVAAGTIAGGYLVGKEIGEHAPGVIHDASVVAHADQHSQKEVAEAHSGLQHVGAAGVDVAATSVGAIIGGALVAPWLGEAGAAGGSVTREAGGEVPVARPRVIRPGGPTNVDDPILTARAKVYGLDGTPPAPRVAELPRGPVKPPHGHINQNDPIFTARAKVYGVDGTPPAPHVPGRVIRPGGSMNPDDPILTARAKVYGIDGTPPAPHVPGRVIRPGGSMNPDDPIFTARAQFVKAKPEVPHQTPPTPVRVTKV